MPAFISYSFDDQPERANVLDALESRKVPYVSSEAAKPGASLREQLRSAIQHCEVCIFVATRHSVNSSWCGAELGAFWGAAKPIIVYLAEASLTDDELPPIVRGDVWERRLTSVADRAKELIGASPASSSSTPRATTSIGQLTVEEFEQLIKSAMSLAAATAKDDPSQATFTSVEHAATQVAGSVLAGFRSAGVAAADTHEAWRNSILWVDDNPDNNKYERQAMESMGLTFTLAKSTDEALRILAGRKFAAIISDMGRKEGPREGYVLLDAVRAKDPVTPFFIYAGARAAQHQREAASRGAQGTTNLPNVLVHMVTEALKSGT